MPNPKNLLLSSLIIGATFLLTQVNFSLYLPIMPVLAHLYLVSSSKIMTSMSYGFFGYMLGQLCWGTASDYYGRKRVLLCALCLYTLCVALIIFSTSIHHFIILFTIMSFAIAAGTSIGNAFLHDLYGPAKVKIAIGYVGIAMAAGPLIFPFIGAHLLNWFNWQTPFIFLLLVCMLVTICIIVTVQEPLKSVPPPNRNKHKHNIVKRFASVLTNRKFLAYIVVLAICFGMFFAYLTVSSFLFTRRLHLHITDYASINLLIIGAYFVGANLFKQLVKKITLKKMTLIALIITILGASALITITLLHDIKLIPVTASLMLLLLGLGIIIPAGKAGCMSCNSQNPGVTASCMKLIQSFGGFSASALAAQLNVPITLLPLSLFFILASVSALIIFSMAHAQS